MKKIFIIVLFIGGLFITTNSVFAQENRTCSGINPTPCPQETTCDAELNWCRPNYLQNTSNSAKNRNNTWDNFISRLTNQFTNFLPKIALNNQAKQLLREEERRRLEEMNNRLKYDYSRSDSTC